MKYELLGKSGLRVSELCLGTMGFGPENGWSQDKKESQAIFDTFANAGGNFLDTANIYTLGTSEKYLGDFIKSDRDHFILGTKYSLRDKENDINFCGNHRKNLFRSVKESLKRLQTEYIDLLWVHAWDFTTSPEEVMRGLDDLIRMGLVHYIGISDTPAWVVTQCNTLAECKGYTPFVALQIEYSLIQRSPERDLIPMCKNMGLTLTPWGAIGGGALSGKYLKGGQGRLKSSSIRLNDNSQRITKKVIEIAEEIGRTPVQVALNWMRHRKFKCVPIVGATKVEQVKEWLGTIDFELEEKHKEALDETTNLDLGFPYSFFKEERVSQILYSNMKDKLNFKDNLPH